MSEKQKASLAPTAYKEFINEFQTESDRAAVILGAAKIDLELYQILRKYLLPTPSSTDELLDGDSPLSTFSAKINMAYRLGLIDSNFARALHLIRRIRNAFAHEISGCKLDSGAHRDRARELFGLFKTLQLAADARRLFFNEEAGPSIDFRIALAIIAARLEQMANRTKPLNDSHMTPLIADGWKTVEESVSDNKVSEKKTESDSAK